MRLLLRIEQATEFTDQTAEQLLADAKVGKLGKYALPKIAGPLFNAAELLDVYSFSSEHMLRMVGRESDADALREATVPKGASGGA